MSDSTSNKRPDDETITREIKRTMEKGQELHQRLNSRSDINCPNYPQLERCYKVTTTPDRIASWPVLEEHLGIPDFQ